MANDITNHAKGKTLRMSSYRLSYWHAPKRARHDEWEVLDCVICRYTEGVALIDDIVGSLRRLGFVIITHDARSFTLDLTTDDLAPSTNAGGLTTKEALYQLISGTSLHHSS